MKKKYWLLVGIIAVVGIITWIVSTHKAPRNDSDKPVVKIGVILPLSGDLANVGESGKNAIMMAVKDANEKSSKYKYELVIDDDRFEIKKDILLANKQIFSDKVVAIINFASSPGVVIAPITEKNKVIYINVGASDPNVSKGKYNFVHWTTPDKTTKKMAEFLKNKNLKNVIIVSEIDAGFTAIANKFIEQAGLSDIKTKMFEVNPSEKDFRPLLMKIKNLNPDAIIVGVWGGALPVFVKQYNEMGMVAPLANIETFSMAPDFFVIEGAYFSDVAQNSTDFNERLHKEYPTTSSDFATGNFYDAVMLIVNAFENANVPENAINELQKIKTYNGIVGHLEQDENGVFQSNAIIKQIKNGKAVLLEE